MIRIGHCPKGYSGETDKALPPDKTVEKVTAALNRHGQAVLKGLRRIDTGRLGIPVYFSYYGTRARQIGVPKRQQMGKGVSPAQSQCSALMELAERYSYFSFLNTPDNFVHLSWKQARTRWKDKLIPCSEIIKSVQEDISVSRAVQALDLVRWSFAPATNVYRRHEEYVPLEWFKKLNEFNGCSAGNTFEESVLQGACELVERHTSAVVDLGRAQTPTLDPGSIDDPVLKDLLDQFARNGVLVWLKDFTMGFPVPTIGALAYDPKTFPALSEIVLTAGTATSPQKAAVRALTEVAQLAGDFHSGSNYEASGLPKFTSLDQISWLTRGPGKDIGYLPDISHPDIGRELISLSRGLAEMGYQLYSISTMQPDLEIPANFNFVPGFLFRERTQTVSIGMIVGRILAEEEDPGSAEGKLQELGRIYPDAFFLPFHQGINLLRREKYEMAARNFLQAEKIQLDQESAAMSAFYAAYALSLHDKWDTALEHLTRAVELDAQVKEYYNLRGVAYYRKKEYALAVNDFQKALELDSGSVMDMVNLGQCYLQQGRKQAAAEMFLRALELDPGQSAASKCLEELNL